MGLTVSIVKLTKNIRQKVVVADITYDSSYASGGESLTPAMLGLNTIDLMLTSIKSGYLFEYDYSNQKLKALYARPAVTGTLAASIDSGATPVTSSAANGAVVTLSGNPAVAAAVAGDVTASTDLSTITVRVMAFGT